MSRSEASLSRAASLYLLYFFALVASFSLTSCDRKTSPTPQWANQEKSSPSPPTLSTPTSSQKSSLPPLHVDDYTFVAYNLENYLQMWRPAKGGRKLTGKPQQSVDQLIDILKEIQPDILGICEIGSEKDLEHLQLQLAQANINLPYSFHTHGSDSVRKLAILSKFPVTSNPQPDIQFKFNGETELIRRGIADAYVELPTRRIRLIGVHFKSKRPSSHYDQELLRRKEAFTLRQHLIKISKDSTTANDDILVYGDFNDTIKSVSLQTVIGSQQSKTYFSPIDLHDAHGLNWTHHWDWQDIYSRFDFILTNQSMSKRISNKKGFIYDVSEKTEASDHRPLVLYLN